MADSTDMFGAPIEDEPEDTLALGTPSAAELEAAGQASMFGDPAPAPIADVVREARAAPPAPPTAPAPKVQPYRVLARKYRPQTFTQLIGQEAMVQTLGNAIRRDRLAHAFLMTGVRGVGKTSTARLIAKALNCIGPDGQGGPTIDPCGVCEPCTAIAEGRHIDVIEMDAASHTGVDDVREIIEAVRYAAVSARYKIYIIDEVHMLSRNAFNALLKTLEEPPPHVKFLFATTEVDKLPVTVLSRCQRFDLRRIQAPVLAAHFGEICRAEQVEAEDEALVMIAAAAEGSVRDGLSILDQAISHADMAGGGPESTSVTAAQVREMLGLADKTMQRRLFTALIGGKGDGVLEEVAGQYALGIEPAAMLRAQLDLVHKVTVAQVTGAADTLIAEERAALAGWAAGLSAGQLHRLWQLLLKGYDEVRGAPDPLVAAQMALLRVMHAAELPDPGGLIKQLEAFVANPPAASLTRRDAAQADGAQMAGVQMAGVQIAGVLASTPGAAAVSASPAAVAAQWARLVGQVEERAPLIGSSMQLAVRVVALASGHLRYVLAPGIAADPAAEMRKALEAVTGEAWLVERVADGTPESLGALPSLEEARVAARARENAAMLDDPLVRAAFAAFPGAEIIEDVPISGQSQQSWSKRA